MNAKQIYLNPKQNEFLSQQHQHEGLFLASRGIGKTTTIGHRENDCARALPGAKFFLAGKTFNQLYNIVLPPYREALKKHGWKEYDKNTGLGHYVVCRRPPSHFAKPKMPAENFDTCISFINGYCRELISFDRSDRNRGGNFDGGDIDEIALFKEDDYDKILHPMVRSNPYDFNDPLHQTVRMYTSVPWLPSGQWIYRFEDEAKSDPNNFLFVEGNVYDNRWALTDKYIARQKRSTERANPLVWQVEYMNKRLKKVPNAYYPAFLEEKHCKEQSFRYDTDVDTGFTNCINNDYDPDKELDFSFDINSNFTSVIEAQDFGNEYWLIGEEFIKDSHEPLPTALAKKLVKKYDSHRHKVVNIYGDPNLKKAFQSKLSSFQQIESVFTAHGWQVNKCYAESYSPHDERHMVMNTILAEENIRIPKIRINANKCKYTIISIQQAPMSLKLGKDKRSEEQNIAQEYATHLSDCFDYLLYPKFAMYLINTNQTFEYWTI